MVIVIRRTKGKEQARKHSNLGKIEADYRIQKRVDGNNGVEALPIDGDASVPADGDALIRAN